MQHFKKIVLAASLLAGCGKSDKAVSTDEFAEGMTALKGFTDRMCACTDADCAKRVDSEESTWEKGVKNGTKPTDAQLAEFQRGKAAYRDCRAKVAK